MKICYFGIYNPSYSRNKLLIRGLRQNGVEVLECNSSLKGPAKYFDLIKKHWWIRNSYDVMVVGFPGFQPMILAKLITRKPIIFDAFLSLYDTVVLDRGLAKKYSFKAGYFWFLDWLSCSLADKVLLDTFEHINFFARTFKINKNKFYRILVGVDDEIFYPRSEPGGRDYFIVHFHGSFIPIHGLKYIIEAANILREQKIIFNVIGAGQEFKKISKLITEYKLGNTVKIHGLVAEEKLIDLLAGADICLGIFGDSDKINRIIPNKLYECLAMEKPVITADTPATREVFSDNQLMLCRAGDAKALAEKIMILKNDQVLRRKLSANSFSLVKEKFVSNILGQELKNIASKLIL